MLKIVIPSTEMYNEKTNEFVNIDNISLELEHSLKSLSKWESKWHKNFLGQKDMSYEEMIDYIRCMTLNEKIDPSVYYLLTDDNLNSIGDYINDSHTATTIYHVNKNTGYRKKQTITSEVIYYLMFAMNIPMECENWHLNKLLTLIEVINIKNTPSKKINPKEARAWQIAENERRRKMYNTKG